MQLACLAVVDPQDGQWYPGAPRVPLLGHAHFDGNDAAALCSLLPAAGHIEGRRCKVLPNTVSQGGCGLCKATLLQVRAPEQRCCEQTCTIYRHLLKGSGRHASKGRQRV